jgi:TrmH family RNA methyltransferase
MQQQYKRYNEKAEYSYCFGPFPTFELIENRPEMAIEVLYHSQTSEAIRDKLISLCGQQGIPCEQNDKVIQRIRDKENCLVVGIFRKHETKLSQNASHIVLVNPSDMGNLGTIIRTAVGFGIPELAIIRPGAAICHPRTVRASMGSLFQLHFQYFDSFEEYKESFGEGRRMYPFMLKGSVGLDQLEREKGERFSLIFGNEATGLPDAFLQEGQSIRIRHTDHIDSLNLSLAAGIAIYEFTKP